MASLPQPSAPEMSPPTPNGISYYFSPQGFATPSLFSAVPISQIRPRHRAGSTRTTFPAAIRGPAWTAKGGRSFPHVPFQPRTHPRLPGPRRRAKYLEGRPHFQTVNGGGIQDAAVLLLPHPPRRLSSPKTDDHAARNISLNFLTTRWKSLVECATWRQPTKRGRPQESGVKGKRSPGSSEAEQPN